MLSRILIGVVGAAGAAVIGVPGVALADPEPAPPAPNINGFALAMPPEYAQVNDTMYAFAAPGGITCALSKGTGSYGCSGPLPNAPGGANVVSGGAAGEPGFSSADRPLFVFDQPVKELPANTRLSYRSVSCGVDAGGSTICTNSFDQSGFVLSPAGSFTFAGGALSAGNGSGPPFPNLHIG